MISESLNVACVCDVWLVRVTIHWPILPTLLVACQTSMNSENYTSVRFCEMYDTIWLSNYHPLLKYIWIFFLFIPQHWDCEDSWNLSSGKTCTHLSYIIHSVGPDDLVTNARKTRHRWPCHWPKLLGICGFHHLTGKHYKDVVMSTMASQITSLTTVYSTLYSGTDQRKYQSSSSLAFLMGIHRGPVNSQHKWPVTRKMFPFDDIIMN